MKNRFYDMFKLFWIRSRCCYTFGDTGNQQVDAIHVTQLERDTVLVCLDRKYENTSRFISFPQ